MSGLAALDSKAVIPLLENRTTIDGLPTAYVCENYTCKQPVTDVSALRDQLSVD